MNTRSAREYTMFAPAKLFRKWREQRPSNRGDLDPERHGGGWDGGGSASGFIFVPYYVTVVGLRFKWHTLYNY
jgi:hypothetical protein